MFDVDVMIQKYLTGKLTLQERDVLLDKLVRFYNDLLIWIEARRKVVNK